MFDPVTITSTAVATDWPAGCGVGATSCANATRRGANTPTMGARHRPVPANFFIAAHSRNLPREFAADRFNRFFHPLTSFVLKTRRRDFGVLKASAEGWAPDSAEKRADPRPGRALVVPAESLVNPVTRRRNRLGLCRHAADPEAGAVSNCIAKVARRVDDDGNLFAGEIFNRPATRRSSSDT